MSNMPFNPVALQIVMARRMITAPELAQRIGKKTSKVNRYLLGINEPSAADLDRIAEALDWPVGFFTRSSVERIDESTVSFFEHRP